MQGQLKGSEFVQNCKLKSLLTARQLQDEYFNKEVKITYVNEKKNDFSGEVKEEKMCEELQELFWRTILQVPKGGPKVMLRAETGSLKMRKRIQKQKLMLAKKISKEKENLAGAIYAEQVRMGWPGLADEVSRICKEVGLGDINENGDVIKKDIEEAIFYSNYKEMKE